MLCVAQDMGFLSMMLTRMLTLSTPHTVGDTGTASSVDRVRHQRFLLIQRHANERPTQFWSDSDGRRNTSPQLLSKTRSWQVATDLSSICLTHPSYDGKRDKRVEN